MVLIGCASARGTDGVELLAAFEAMYEPDLDTSVTYSVDSLVLSCKDLEIVLSIGRLAFFPAVMIDGEEKGYAAYFKGTGQIMFTPPVAMEREQLDRFFKTDSLNRSFEEALFLFSSDLTGTILERCRPIEYLFREGERKDAKMLYKALTKDDNRYYLYEALSNIVHPTQRPYLLANLEPDNSDPIFYIYNPEHREEVRLLKKYSQIALSFMETICQYSEFVDEAYYNINGLPKARLAVDRYTVDATISDGMDFEAMAEMSFDVLVSPTQILAMSLHHKLKVDSIVDSAGQQVAFYRYEKGDEESRPLYLFFDRPLESGEYVKLKFYYQGDIIRKEMGQCFVLAGGGWYPRYGYRQRALFTLNFKTPKKYAFISCGKKVSEEVREDTLVTTWKVVPPAANVSFNIGPLKKHSFEEKELAPVNLYFSEDFHRELVHELAMSEQGTSRNPQKQVGEDIVNSLRLFNEYFGPYPFEELIVSEILLLHGEAFPGFLHLGVETWINTDAWGYDRTFRAHEVAHQWWGVGVGYETYHDQWLSEGLAEYGALLYLQAAAGNDKFIDRIRDYRNDIFSARQYLLGSGEESGPIALGYRTASTKTRGDYNLIIYKKAALVVHMLRNMLLDLKTMKEDVFQTMMKEFFGANRGRDVRSLDFRKAVEKYTGMDMAWFFDQWVYSSDLPTYEFSYEYENEPGGTFTARCSVLTTGVPENFQMYVPLEIEIDQDAKAYIRVFIDRPAFEFTLPGLPRKPKKLRLNPFESVLARVKQ